MFAGEYLCKVDEKGRFIVPSPIREQIEAQGQSVVFLKGPEESILIYSMKEWEKVLERTKGTLDEEQSRLFMHFVVSEAGTSEIDKAGRIPLIVESFVGAELVHGRDRLAVVLRIIAGVVL